MYRLAMSIKGLPPTLNARFGTAAKWRQNVEWYAKVKCELLFHKLPAEPLKKARVTLTRYSGSRRPDFDNLVSGFKPVLDALKKFNIIHDDRHSEIGLPVYKWERAAPGQGRITVVVEEIADAAAK